MEEEIVAIFTTETARWNENLEEYVDRESRTEVKDIKMVVETRDDKAILRFVGGPTGYESYYIEDLDGWKDRVGSFCICGGTVNRWPKCEVHWPDVQRFLVANGF